MDQALKFRLKSKDCSGGSEKKLVYKLCYRESGLPLDVGQFAAQTSQYL
jgi:hypothetical protein